jgi:hypothetical protein
MAENFLRTLAEDLLNLEINTIIKPEMSAVKLPSSRRQALYELSAIYNSQLEELQVREPVYWEFSGVKSFGELRDRAKDGIQAYQEQFSQVSPQGRATIMEQIKMLERIQDQSSQVVGMFKRLEQRVKDKTNSKVPGYSHAPETVDVGALSKPDRAEPHRDSELWNNDIDRIRMNEIEDLHLKPDQLSMIRKAWEIGTERIVLQTVIQLDGDITTRIAESFANNPIRTILTIHNESVGIVAGFWSTLVKTFGEIFGKTLEVLLGK